VEALMSMREILQILPHRYPFLLVDRVISIEPGPDEKSRVGRKIVAMKNLTANEPFFQGHFPGLPIMPGVLQIEAMAQAACLVFYRPSDPPMNYFIAAIEAAKFRRMVVPGDTLMLHAEILKDRGSILVVKAQALVDGQVASEVELMAKVSRKDEA
jgi:beta-hydroxyacyl-ACP dehydratase FabZ